MADTGVRIHGRRLACAGLVGATLVCMSPTASAQQPVGMNALVASRNAQFLLNVVRWLAAGR